MQSSDRIPLWYSYEGALNWLVTHRVSGAGVAVTDTNHEPYPEVTGYIVPTLLDCGERELAIDLARWLISIQQPEGGFVGPDGRGEPYLFDTAQVMRGLLAVVDYLPDAAVALRRAADWMLATTDEAGVIRPKPDSAWSREYAGHISENIHIYALTPLLEAGRLLGEQRYIDCVERSIAYYTVKPDITRFRFLTHFYGYVLEALVDLGHTQLARQGLQEIMEIQTRQGAIPAVPGAKWICSPGQAQLAIVGYKLGLVEFANAALDYLQQQQTPSGGFLGSYGPGAAYSPLAEPSWACKYFLDACHWRMRTTFAHQQDRFRAEGDLADIRLHTILESVGNVGGKRVLDVGCGKGQFLRALQQRYPSADLWGIDISPDLLSFVPAGVHTQCATALNLPFDDASFDVVLCVEALEHVVRIERAVSEMCRMLKSGGTLLIVDKDARHLGIMPIEVWERWFTPDDITTLLGQYCSDVSNEPLYLPVGGETLPFLIAWKGQRHHVRQWQTTNRGTGLPSRDFPRRLVRQYQDARRRAQAHDLVGQGFEYFQNGNGRTARRFMIAALQNDPSWALNRGVISVIVRSLIRKDGQW